MKKKLIEGLKCPKCGDEIYSMHRHDFRYCKCRYCFIDGGRDYLRAGWGCDGDTSNELPITISKEIQYGV